MSSWRRHSNGIAVYQESIIFLQAACAQSPRREVSQLQQSLKSYLLPTSSVDAIVTSSGCRKLLLQLASELNLYDDAGFKNRLRTDEQRVATLLGSIFDSKANEGMILRLQGDSAQVFLDVVQDAIDQGFLIGTEHSMRARRIIRKLSESCDKLPSSLFITGVTDRDAHPTFGGGFADVYRASYGKKTVALKHMRYFLRGAELRRVNLKFCREALVWKDLHHPNILPFLGIDRDTFPSSLCMVSPWMEHGTILNHLEKHSHTNVDKLLCHIALGIHYLHSRNIVHGDLRGANILINEHWSACLSDFGLSSFNTATTSKRTSTRSGSIYWMAPELISPERFGLQFSRTPASDVYAFACVCVEVYTGRPPFSKLTEAAALFAIINGERPERPSGVPAMSDALWQFVSVYWSQNPDTRPISAIVAQNLTSLTRPQRPSSPIDHSPAQTGTSSVPSSEALKPDPHQQAPLQSPHQRTNLLTRIFTREKPRIQTQKHLDIRLSISERDEGSELPRKIRLLTTTHSEDWALLLEVCNHASFNETNAQETAHALRSELQHSEPRIQLAAVRIWAILLRNTSNVFLSQSSSRKFLNTIEDIMVSPNTLPTVRAHVLTVVAAAAYATASKKDTGFRVLWKRIKPADGPEDGIPFKADDPIFDVPSTCFETEDLELAGIVRALLPLMDENGVSPFPLSAVPAISTQRNAKASEARAARPPSETESLPPYRDIDDRSATDGSVNKAKALSSYVATANDPDGVSFRQDEIVEITNQIGHWLLIQTSDGRRGSKCKLSI
ncbi:kinase-like domain-containing protein [Roridomyces roridus]|uniref:Kinase-like domain-containing protein n=1 Tax=Roridomyces roridus TaxID=1738132 RepID=A0AAD7CE55_9AGAR|nr:kinase-like domain-containing protein [Roridomyces roridus]